MSFRSFRYYAKKYNLVKKDDIYDGEAGEPEETEEAKPS
jgi:hypothetical protein